MTRKKTPKPKPKIRKSRVRSLDMEEPENHWAIGQPAEKGDDNTR